MSIGSITCCAMVITRAPATRRTTSRGSSTRSRSRTSRPIARTSSSITGAACTPDKVSRYWLHQANQKLNEVVAEWVLGRVPTRAEAPIILDEYGNTASAGSLLAFSLHSDDLAKGNYGLMCSFGAGYSLGALLLQKM